MNSESIGEYIAVRIHSQVIILSSLPWSGCDEHAQLLPQRLDSPQVRNGLLPSLISTGVSPLLRRRLSEL